MALAKIRSFSVLILIVTSLLASFPQGHVYARAVNPTLPALQVFVEQVKDGQGGLLRGIYVPGLMAARIVQQPSGHSDFVSPRKNILTQFALASRFDAIGLLAHNYLAGENFSLLEPGQVIYLVYGDGRTTAFVVKEILSYQALDPLSTTSKFVDLKSSKLLKAGDLMQVAYDRPGQLVLQTCIEKNNNRSWGRLFVVAEPYSAG